MRNGLVLGAALVLAGCSQGESDAERTAVDATPAALTYDGADFGDDREAMLAHGDRLTTVLGCRGCHTPSMEGQYFPPGDPVEFYAPNITLTLGKLDDAQLETLLRTGVHPDREIWYMPAEGFQHLSDADMAALIAFLRTVEPSGDPQPYVPMPEATVAQYAEAGFHNANTMYKKAKGVAPPDLGGGDMALGRYIARTTCAECHQPDMEGFEGFTPALADVGGMYDDAAFIKLLTTGEGLEGRTLGLMAAVGQGHFGALTDHERQAVIDYVQGLSEAKMAAGAQ